MARQKTGRKATGKAKFPLQSNKLNELVNYLIEQQIITSQGELVKNFGVTSQTISNWAIGARPIGIREKKVFAHDFDVPIEWWDQKDIPIEDVIGQGLGKDEKPQPLREVAAIRQFEQDIKMMTEALRAVEKNTQVLLQTLQSTK